MNNGQLLQQFAQASQQPQVVLSTPLNDTQLIAMCASQIGFDLPAVDAVERAMCIVVEAVARSGELKSRIAARKRELSRSDSD